MRSEAGMNTDVQNHLDGLCMPQDERRQLVLTCLDMLFSLGREAHHAGISTFRTTV